jgi:general secretion pathway protein H
MQILALGNLDRRSTNRRGRAVKGFTLLELLLVVTLIALTTAGVSLSLRDTAHTQLVQEGQRLAALMEAARAQARANGVPVVWKPQPRGFSFDGQYRDWAISGIVVHRMPVNSKQPPPVETEIWLPPEPLMPAQRLRLSVNGYEIWLGTNGVSPWRLLEGPDASL